MATTRTSKRWVGFWGSVSILGLQATLACSSGGTPDDGGLGGEASGGAPAGGSSASGGAGTGGAIPDVVPPGLEDMPQPIDCVGEECSGVCLSAENTEDPACSVLTIVYSPRGVDLPGDGYAYVAHAGGIARVELATKTSTDVLTDETENGDFIGPVAVLNDDVYYARTLSTAGFFHVPIAGGVPVEVGDSMIVDGLVRRGGALFLEYFSKLERYTVADGVAPYIDSFEDAFIGEASVTWTSYPDFLQAPLDDASTPTTLDGEGPTEDFVVIDGRYFAVGPSFSSLVEWDPVTGEGTELWSQGTGSYYEGTIYDVRAFPGINGVFFSFETEPFVHLMMWDVDAGTMHRVASLHPQCFREYTVAGDLAYVSGCQAVVQAPLP